MSKLWEELIESGVINEQVQKALVQKLEEAKSETRKLVENEVRAELTSRFEKDKGELVSAIDKFLNEAITKELTEFQQDRLAVKAQKVRLEKAIKEARSEYKAKINEHTRLMQEFIMKQLRTELSEFAGDRKAIAEQRVKLSRAILEARRTYETKLKEHTKVLNNFVLTKLNEEVTEFAQDKKELTVQQKQTAKKLREHRIALQNQFASRTKMLESFVLGQLKKEIKEFKEDKDALVEQRVKLTSQYKQELAETKQKFVKHAAKIVESTLQTQLRKEMEQFRDDIKVARENHFGRKIFEAFSAEFMTSYLAEGTKVKQVTKKLEEAQAQIEATKKRLDESLKAKELTERKIKISEDKAQRAEILNNLLSPLKRDKKEMMANLLESVKTEQLKNAYNKYLPHVLNEGSNSKSFTGRANLNESRSGQPAQRQTSKIVEATGNRPNRLSESAQAEIEPTAEDKELADILFLAGRK
jgi:hypothetical protein